MPTYTYTCTACNEMIEKRQSFSDPRLTTCEQCGGALRKVIHPVGIVFKGSGWYITDSRSASSSANGRNASSSTTSETTKSSESSGSSENSGASKESSSKADSSASSGSKSETSKSGASKSEA